jgi:hypothetical protein
MSDALPIICFRKSAEDVAISRQAQGCTDCIFIRRFETLTCALDDFKTGTRLTRCAEYDDLL